jgi:hypothetical protein
MCVVENSLLNDKNRDNGFIEWVNLMLYTEITVGIAFRINL